MAGRSAALGLAIVMLASAAAHAQRGGGPPRSPREAAPVDLTGYWVSVITEDWRWRMVTPARGDFSGVPLTPEGRRIGEAWDPTKDEADGVQCKAYGAAAIMRVPGRLHITWQDDTTLRIDTDAGRQTRLFRFATAPPGAAEAGTGQPDWQGYSVANWEAPLHGSGPPDFTPIALNPREGTRGRALEVHTANLRPGYLRRNGAPYSARTELQEYFDVFTEKNGDTWLTVTTIVTDPQYLTTPFVTSSNFKKEKDAAGWHPTDCKST